MHPDERTPVSSPGALSPGVVLSGTYRIVQPLAAGGMGDVYVAHHQRLGGPVAIKVLSREMARNHEACVRFGREASVLSSLRHPNVVQVLDYDVTEDGAPFLALELLEGADLRCCLERDGRMPLGRVVGIVRQVASALDAAHARGIVHRDLKPDNIILRPLRGHGELVKVLDFGISQVLSSRRITGQAATIGTPEYMSPEQAQGRHDEMDGRSDQFALAALTYTLLAGRPPFSGANPVATLFQVVHQEPAPLSAWVSWPTDAVDAVLRRALAKRPDQRFPGVLDFAEALAASAAAAPPAEPPAAPVWQVDARPALRHKRALRVARVLALAALVAGAAAAAWAARRLELPFWLPLA